MKPFLTAEWRNLLNITFAVPHQTLLPYLPKGLELDMQGGNAFVSLVAFDFLHTRIRGLAIPFHVNFPEINLRFYVKYREQRGVVFLKELVPRTCVATIARRLYNEPYESVSMNSSTKFEGDNQTFEHHFRYNNQPFSIWLQANRAKAYLPAEDSIEHFFKEHEWGYGTLKSGKVAQYRVEHERWQICPVIDYQLNLDFGAVYGENWKFLNVQTPVNMMLAEGSAVKVFPYRLLSMEDSNKSKSSS